MGPRGIISNSLFDSNVGGGWGSPAIYWQDYNWAGFDGTYSTLYVLESKFFHHNSQTPSAAVINNFFGQIVIRGIESKNNEPIVTCKVTSSSVLTNKFFSLGENDISDRSCPEQ